MVYSPISEMRFRDALGTVDAAIETKAMMGSLVFMMGGYMLGGVGTSKAGAPRFLFRVGREGMAEALTIAGAEPLKSGERIMSGYVLVPESQCDEATLARMMTMAKACVTELMQNPPKTRAPSRRRKPATK